MWPEKNGPQHNTREGNGIPLSYKSGKGVLIMYERPLFEIALKQTNKLIEWCEGSALWSHKEHYEYMFWIPPYSGHEVYLKETYGEYIPVEIENELIKAIHLRAEMEDSGFLIIILE
jgi:hypothetical protein